MSGRDPRQGDRVSTPLELLFDLTFAAAFGVAGTQFAHLVAEGAVGTGIVAFCFAVFAIVWAWINFTWFASAFDCDDWIYRLTTMVQMVGVVILALGLPTFFAALHHHRADNLVMVLGYVVMRLAMLFQWGRVAVQAPEHRRAATAYVWTILLAQVGWVLVALAHTSVTVFFCAALVLVAIEILGPLIAERHWSTPWHAHHIAERYGLLAIITLGEGVIGTVAASATSIEEGSGWDTDAVLVVMAGILTFGLWWMYFSVDFANVLHRRRSGSFTFGYGHIPLLGALAAVGAGLHVAGYYLAGEARISNATAAASVIGPVGLYTFMLFAIFTAMVGSLDRFHLLLVLGTAIVLATSLVMANVGADLGICLLVASLAPFVTVIGYEALGHRHQTTIVSRLG